MVLPTNSTNKKLPSIVQVPQLKLKPLHAHLNYVFMAQEETFTIIIKSNLKSKQEENLVKLVCKHVKAIGWSLVDIRGISPTLCVHEIHSEEGAKPVRVPRLNTPMTEVVKKEVI